MVVVVCGGRLRGSCRQPAPGGASQPTARPCPCPDPCLPLRARLLVLARLASQLVLARLLPACLPAPAPACGCRVYQRPDAINVGCSPPDFPTAQYIACNRHKFVMSEEEEGMLVREQCSSNVVGAAAGRAPLRGLLHGGLAAAASALLALAP